MNYEEAIDWLYGTQMFGIKLGLDNSRRLHRALDLPGRMEGRRILHVAGTNGKGSVCAFADQILRDGGLHVGLFTSPHLVSFPERVRVDGKLTPRESIARHLDRIRPLVADWEAHPTFFEIALAAALLEFCDQECEVVILETGMGGRLDATNSVRTDLSVITSIALDHQQWLGEDIRTIASEKAGILREGVPVIVGDLHPDAREVVGRRALELGIPMIEAHPLPPDWKIGIPGSHQRINAALAVEAACRIEEQRLTLQGIRDAVEKTHWPGRFHRVGDTLVLDGAHNGAAGAALVETWREVYGPDARPTIIFGAARSKDVVAILGHLLEIADRFLFVPIRSERRYLGTELQTALDDAGGRDRERQCLDSVAEALEHVAGSPGMTLITGSLFLVGEALSLLDEQPFEVSLQ